MNKFNLEQFLTINGVMPVRYNVDRKEISGCRETLIIVAYYYYQNCSKESIIRFTFYLWKLPTAAFGIFDVMLSSFESTVI